MEEKTGDCCFCGDATAADDAADVDDAIVLVRTHTPVIRHGDDARASSVGNGRCRRVAPRGRG